MTTSKKNDREAAAPQTIVRRLLRRRTVAFLETVERCRDSVKPVEQVHELRVTSRRLDAALSSCAAALPADRRKRIRKQVQRIRRAAGRVRDLDVLILRLRKASSDGSEKPVISELRNRRRTLARELAKRLSDLNRSRLRRDLERTARVPDGAGASVVDLGNWSVEQVQPAAGRFLGAASKNLRKIDNLHRLRRRGKQLRYSLELFRECLDRDALSPLLKSLERIQEQLGNMNDHATAYELLSDVVAGSADDPALRNVARKLAKREKRHLKRERRRFLKWWVSGAGERIARRLRRCVPIDSAVSVAS